jgi:transposase
METRSSGDSAKILTITGRPIGGRKVASDRLQLRQPSDARLVSQAQTDMAVKYFLNLDPEAEMIDSSLMTKFRKTRITEDILEEMLKEIVRQAIEKGVIKSKSIIVDSTHTLE